MTYLADHDQVLIETRFYRRSVSSTSRQVPDRLQADPVDIVTRTSFGARYKQRDGALMQLQSRPPNAGRLLL